MPSNELTIRTEGITEVCAWLDQLPQRFAKSALARSLAAAAVPIVEHIRSRTPERDMDERDENIMNLVDALQTTIRVDTQGKGGSAIIDFGKMGYLALWLEYGWRLTGHKPDKKFIKLVPENGNLYLTGSSRHFMLDGLDAAVDEAISAFCDSFSKSLDEYSNQLPASRKTP
jgi:hypothetical protein